MKASNHDENHSNKNGHNSKVAHHRRAALIAICRAAMEVDDLREVVARGRRFVEPIEPEDVHEVVEQLEERLMEEGRALGVFDDEYDCDCGCSGDDEGESHASGTFEDEAAPPQAANARDTGRAPGVRSSRTPVGFVATMFGALGVACAMASLVLRSDLSRSAE